ncbi:unnamed protein product, partial [Adineta steineri]
MRCYYEEIRASTVISTYSSFLTPNSATFTRPSVVTGRYYYAVVQVSISTPGVYQFSSFSSIDTYGYFYNDTFKSIDPSSHLIAENDDDASDDKQFLISIDLQSNRRYTLVTTTHGTSVTGSIKIIAVGPAAVDMVLISAKSAVYSGSIISNILTFTRPESTSGKYYYATTPVKVATSGLYEFGSWSELDTYGCLYNGRFIPLTPSLNLIAQDNDGLDDDQFLISVHLQSNRTYTLVITTHRELTTGSFSIIAVGPDTIQFTSVATTIGTMNTFIQK